MDYLDQLSQLMESVKRMRQWQVTGRLTDVWLVPLSREESEARVDELLAAWFGEDLADTQLDLREQLYTDSAAALRDVRPDLPPPPARELPDLSTLLPQWKPDTEATL